MQSRNQYLREVRKEYLQTKERRERGKILDEAGKRTGLERKYLIKKLRPKSNLDTIPEHRKKRPVVYDARVRAALAVCWRIFDRPCGQRLEPLLKTETDKLRRLRELQCSSETAEKLKKIDASTIDEKLKHTKEVERDKLKYLRRDKVNPLLYRKIPVKVFGEQDRRRVGNIQIDLVEHCGQSAAGEYAYTLVATDICTGWTEQEAVLGKAQESVHKAVDRARRRFPYAWRTIHTDNGREFINNQLFRYARGVKLGFSRSRPYRKNDNALVEQKNGTHVRRMVGYLRYDTHKEVGELNALYRGELRLYKNFFQPVMKLASKEWVGSRAHKKYDTARTPHQRVMESSKVSRREKDVLRGIYESLNPGELKRSVDKRLDLLYAAYQKKDTTKHKVERNPKKKQRPVTVSYYIRQPAPVRCHS